MVSYYICRNCGEINYDVKINYGGENRINHYSPCKKCGKENIYTDPKLEFTNKEIDDLIKCVENLEKRAELKSGEGEFKEEQEMLFEIELILRELYKNKKPIRIAFTESGGEDLRYDE